MKHLGRVTAGLAMLIQIAATIPAGAEPAPRVSQYTQVRRAEIEAILTSVSAKTDRAALEALLAEPLVYSSKQVDADGKTTTFYTIPAKDTNPSDVKDRLDLSEMRYADERAASFGFSASFGMDRRVPDCVLFSDILWSAGEGGWVQSGKTGDEITTTYILKKADMELRVEAWGQNAADPTHFGADSCVAELAIYTQPVSAPDANADARALIYKLVDGFSSRTSVTGLSRELGSPLTPRPSALGAAGEDANNYDRLYGADTLTTPPLRIFFEDRRRDGKRKTPAFSIELLKPTPSDTCITLKEIGDHVKSQGWQDIYPYVISESHGFQARRGGVAIDADADLGMIDGPPPPEETEKVAKATAPFAGCLEHVRLQEAQ